jgi:hypothetical protein
MNADCLPLQVARNRVRGFAESFEELSERPNHNGDSRDCEEFLRRGIDAFEWLRRCEEMLREADYAGVATLHAATQEAIGMLYTTWLDSCGGGLQWLDRLESRSLQVEHADRFREICDDVNDIVASRQWLRLADTARTLATTSEPW